MTRRMASLLATILVPAVLVAVPVLAQENRGAASSGAERGGGGGGGAVASGGGGSVGSAGGGGVTTGGGGATSGGGGSAVAGGGGGGAIHSGGGGHSGATGGSGVAYGDRGGHASRGESGGGNGGGPSARSGGSHGANGGGTAVARGSGANGGSTTSNGTATSTGTATPRAGDNSGSRQPRTVDGAPEYSRPRDGRSPVGTAVPRGSAPSPGTGGGVYLPGGGAYPCLNAGYWYYGGYYDPWYGGYPDPAAGQIVYQNTDEGSLRLKIKPRQAEVYVDGYFAGIVDDFDGVFQSLKIEAGPHRIEIRAAGFEPLTFDVRITAEHKTTYEGELKKTP